MAKPDSARTTLSQGDEREGYPDFMVVLERIQEEQSETSGPKGGKDLWPQGIHSLWEVKAGKQSDGDASDSMALNQSVQESFKANVRQLLEQAKGAFAEYPYLEMLHIFFVCNMWVRHTMVLRSNMPDFHDCRDPDIDPQSHVKHFGGHTVSTSLPLTMTVQTIQTSSNLDG